MATGKKVTTTIRVNDFIREKLRKQAHAVGMDVSNYVAYLVLFREDYLSEERRFKNAKSFS